MRVLLIGGAGYIVSHIAATLSQRVEIYSIVTQKTDDLLNRAAKRTLGDMCTNAWRFEQPVELGCS